MFSSQLIKGKRNTVVAAALTLCFASATHAQETPGSTAAADRIARMVTSYETEAPETAVNVELEEANGDTATYVTTVPATTGHGGTCTMTLVKTSVNWLGWEAKSGSCKLG